MTQERETAKKIVEILDRGASDLDAATLAGLASARRQAVAAMEGRIRVANVELAHAGTGHSLTSFLHGRNAWMTTLAAVAILLMVVAMVQKNFVHEPVEADALLLASDLPPEAYVDKGFDAWLENSSQP